MDTITINIRINLDAATRQPLGPHQVRIKLSGWADEAEQIGGMFRGAFELEMLRGTRRHLPEGSVRYRFEVDDEKAIQLRQWLTAAFFPLTDN